MSQAQDATRTRLIIEDSTSGDVSPLLFGQFLERPSWDGEGGPEAVCDDEGKLPDAVEQSLRGMHTPVVRFPHGTDGDFADWTDLVDLPDRPRPREYFGHRDIPVGTRFGFDEFRLLADKLGWSSILVTNLRDALYRKKPLAEAAVHAAALAAYYGAETAGDSTGWAGIRVANGFPTPGKISAVQVGNEAWAFWPPGEKDRETLGLTSDAECAAWLRQCLIAYADAIHSVLPEVPLIADAPRWIATPSDRESASAAIWQMALDHPDIRSRFSMLAAHAYAPMGFSFCEKQGQPVDPRSLNEEEIWQGMLAALGQFDEEGQAVADRDSYQRISKMGFRVAVTEWNWNGWGFKKTFPQAGYNDSVPAGLSAAAFLHGLMRSPSVSLATQSMLLGTKWDITAVRSLPDGRPTYLPQGDAVRLLAEFHGDKLVDSQVEGGISNFLPPRFSIAWPQALQVAQLDALVTANGRFWFVHLVHRDRTKALNLTISLPGSAPKSGTARVHQLIPRTDPSMTLCFRREEQKLVWSRREIKLLLGPAVVAVVAVPRNH